MIFAPNITDFIIFLGLPAGNSGRSSLFLQKTGMHLASFTGVLKFILILLLIYYGLKILTRLLAPLLLRYVTKKAGQKFERFFQQQSPTNSTPEGEVTIQRKSKKKSNENSGGEYIDFEEID